MASISNDQDDIITGINVTPMVDVMLVLLVIFMMAAPTLYNKSIKVELPAAKSGEKTEKITLKFAMLKDGKILLDKKEIQRSDLDGILQKALKSDAQADALIDADRALTHGSVIEFIDQLKSAGIKRFALGVEGSERKK